MPTISRTLCASGVCASPGIASGPLVVWDPLGYTPRPSPGSVVLLDSLNGFPLPHFLGISGIISQRYTAFSHLASIAAMLDIPCIVGARFRGQPPEGEIVTLDAIRGLLFSGRVEHLDSKVFRYDNDAIRLIRAAKGNRFWLQTLYLGDLSGSLLSCFKGIFIDAQIVRIYEGIAEQTNKERHIVSDLRSALSMRSDLKIGFRLSQNPRRLEKQTSDSGYPSFRAFESVKEVLGPELQLITHLTELEAQVDVFFL